MDNCLYSIKSIRQYIYNISYRQNKSYQTNLIQILDRVIVVIVDKSFLSTQ
jgi:hypothetical protein